MSNRATTLIIGTVIATNPAVGGDQPTTGGAARSPRPPTLRRQAGGDSATGAGEPVRILALLRFAGSPDRADADVRHYAEQLYAEIPVRVS